MVSPKKRERGQFFTRDNPFSNPAFSHWAHLAGLPNATILEPFAGANDLITMLQELDLCKKFESFDIAPANSAVQKRDTIKEFPQGFRVAITNPPWLAKNSATRRGLAYPACKYDNLYKHCLALCLEQCEYVAAIIPASFLQSALFTQRLQAYVLLHQTIFADTENPVCLALFTPQETESVALFYDSQRIGFLEDMTDHLPLPINDYGVRFNDPKGQLGLFAADNNKEPTIRFIAGKEIDPSCIKTTSRFITRIGGNFERIDDFVQQLNDRLAYFRDRTKDVFLTPFKGLRADGMYRRRIDYALARNLINGT